MHAEQTVINRQHMTREEKTSWRPSSVTVIHVYILYISIETFCIADLLDNTPECASV